MQGNPAAPDLLLLNRGSGAGYRSFAGLPQARTGEGDTAQAIPHYGGNRAAFLVNNGRNFPQPGPRQLIVLTPGSKVRLRCPKNAPAKCRIKARAVTKRRHGKAMSKVARAKIQPGHSKLVALRAKARFADRLAIARKVLVRERIKTGGRTRTRYKRLKLIRK